MALNIKPDPEVAKFFWSKVDVKDDIKCCWNWLGAKKPKGYGNVRINSKYMLAHRVAFELTNNIDTAEFKVCHVCDNPSCCNPNHLMLGTTKSNYIDMVIKNRGNFKKNKASGIKNVNSKLTWEQVCNMREMYKTGSYTYKQLSKIFGMSDTGVSLIVRNKSRLES